MFAEVALDAGPWAAGTFTYSAPAGDGLELGAVVLVPFGPRRLAGLVVGLTPYEPPFPTRPIDAVLDVRAPLSPTRVELARWMASYYRAPFFECVSLLLPPGFREQLELCPSSGKWPSRAGRRREEPRAAQATSRAEGSLDAVPHEGGGSPSTVEEWVLNRHQLSAFAAIEEAVRLGEHRVFLLFGVTGSGKTHVYLEAIKSAIRRGRQAIVLVSEIALTPEAAYRIAKHFPRQVAVLHSGLSPREYGLEWERVRSGEAAVVVGARSAIFAPAPDLGLIVLDEEHEWAYKQDSTPRYHARDVAIRLGQLSRVPVVLCSATPDVSTYYQAEAGVYQLLVLPERYTPAKLPAGPPDRDDRPQQAGSVRAGAPVGARQAPFALPTVDVVDMRQELREGNTGIFSRRLLSALGEVLVRGEQAILYLNRRGVATAVTCRDCGFVARCSRCDVPMVYHGPPMAERTSSLHRHAEPGKCSPMAPEDGTASPTQDTVSGILVCHRCNRRRPPLRTCPGCGSQRIRFFGTGTQRVEQEVISLFPEARVLRWDRDVARRGRAHDTLREEFASGRANVLVGTQMVAKALDFPRVTLVGVVLADVGLFLPDFRAAERTFQLLTQVVGRAGRGPSGGRAIIQTYSPHHYAIQAARAHDYLAFYRKEIAFRRRHQYPPFARLTRLVVSASNDRQAWQDAMRVRRSLVGLLASQGVTDVDVLGPAPCYYHRTRGRYRWQIVLRGDQVQQLLDLVRLHAGWSVDVDPVSLL